MKTTPPAAPPKPSNSLELLHERLAMLAETCKVLENTAEAETRDLSEAEVAKIESAKAEFRQVEAMIAAKNASAEMQARLEQPNQRQIRPDVEDAPTEDRAGRQRAHNVQVGDRVGVKPGGYGFSSLGQYAIAAARTFRGMPDNRIVNAPTTFGQEAIGADGGFAVPPDFRSEIMKQIMGEESLFARTDQQVTASNSLILPLDVATPWQTSGGVLAGWSGEAQALTQSKPALQQLECKANKLTALVPLTDELLEDVPAMTRWLQSKVPEKFTSALNAAIVAGSGVGQPRGILNEAALVTVTAVSGQGAGTVVANNISAMWTRLYSKLRPNAIWLINQDVEPQLQTMAFPGATPAFPAYMPPGGFSASPYATLFGRPILPVEACSTVGTVGDIILTDLTQYLTVVKAGGIRADASMHLFFDTDTTAFRFILRVGGMSYWPAAVTRLHGNNSLSSMVALSSTRT